MDYNISMETNLISFIYIFILKIFMKKFFLAASLFLPAYNSFSQENIPINPDTKMVSVNNVVHVKDTSVTKIKEIADKFIQSNSSTTAFGAVNKLTRKTKDKMPTFYGRKVLDQDSIVTYDIQMTIFYPHTSGGLLPTASSDMATDLFTFKLLIYIKKGRFKYDFTNITHSYQIGAYKGFSGGKFENEKPEKTSKLLSSDKSAWTEMKKDVIVQIRNIAREFEKSFSTTTINNQFNF